MTQRPRRTFFVDREVQGALVWRVLLYWHFFLVSIALLLLARELWAAGFSHLGEVAQALSIRYSPVLFASLIVLPVVMLDVVHVTNRIAGPVLRLKQGLKDVAEGRPAQPLRFRKQDFWGELAADFNRAAARAASNSTNLAIATEEMPQQGGGLPSLDSARRDALLSGG